MRDDAFRADLWRLRDAWESEMDAWWDDHADAPRSEDARVDLQGIGQKYGDRLRELLERNGVDVPAGAGSLLRGLGGAPVSVITGPATTGSTGAAAAFPAL
jgi:hypothetical protein